MRPVNKIAQHLLHDEVNNERTTVHNSLIDAIGNYCSYCEMPLSGYHIEHLRYTARWPESLSLSQWDDLLLICNDCRSNILVPELNESSVSAMLWPDRDITFNLYNSPLKYQLRNVKYVVISAEGERISEENKELVFVIPNPNVKRTLYEKAFNTIVHFQLNMKLEYYDTVTNELRVPEIVHLQRLDNRIFKRTEAWHCANDALDRIRQVNEISATKQETALVMQLLINQIAMTAWYSGNWSVWMTVFQQQAYDLTTIKQILLNSQHPFPGTRNDNNQLFTAE